jgi:hypothetical protein
MNPILESKAYFRFLDYHISHKQLLIRGENAIEGDNIDVVFEGTHFLNCPTTFNGIKIYLLDEDSSKTNEVPIFPFAKNFLVESEGKKYFIQAGALRIFRNSLTLWESCIMTERGQENLLWISR